MPSRSIIRTGVGPHREPRNRFPAMAAAINLLAARAARVQSRRNLSRSLSPKLDHSHSITRFDRSRTGPNRGRYTPQDLRRTISAIVWRHQNGAKWRAIPAELGPWSRAAQMFIRWAHLGVWERLLLLAQERGVQLGMTFLDGTRIRAHHKAAGAEKRGPTARRAMSVRRWAARVGAMGPRRA